MSIHTYYCRANILTGHLEFVKRGEYGLARDRLPRNIALPIVKVAQIAGFKPFMEYAGSYALYNYRMEDESKGMEYSNLRLIRAFEHGLDPTSSEAGFVLVHGKLSHCSSLFLDQRALMILKSRWSNTLAF